MSIEARKISLAQRLFAIQKETILDKIEELLSSEFLSLTNDQKEAIDEGIKALDEGKSNSHQQVMEATKKRYPNLFNE